MIREIRRQVASGYAALIALFLATVAVMYWLVRVILAQDVISRPRWPLRF
jgi:hypothetical protein